VVDFPGDHGGFLALPEQCGRVLDQVLTERPEPAETLQGSAAGRTSRTTRRCTSSERGGRPVDVDG
jgi:hypothetical protein